MFIRNAKGQFVPNIKRGKQSKAIKEKISIANSGEGNGMWRGGKPYCKECGIQLWWGSIYCRKHSKSGERNPNKKPENRKKLSESAYKRFMVKENHPRWKDAGIGYVSLHKWVANVKGKPSICEHCKTTEKRQYHWANKSGKYLRDINDWIRLCVPCHNKYDKQQRTQATNITN